MWLFIDKKPQKSLDNEVESIFECVIIVFGVDKCVLCIFVRTEYLYFMEIVINRLLIRIKKV